MRQWVKEAGKSEGRFVMKRIGVQHLPHAKAGANAAFDDFQLVFHHKSV
jgi:hypothetical protein